MEVQEPRPILRRDIWSTEASALAITCAGSQPIFCSCAAVVGRGGKSQGPRWPVFVLRLVFFWGSFNEKLKERGKLLYFHLRGRLLTVLNPEIMRQKSQPRKRQVGAKGNSKRKPPCGKQRQIAIRGK